MQRALRRATTRNRAGTVFMVLGVISFVIGGLADIADDVLVRLLPDALVPLHPEKLMYVVGPVLFGAGTLLRRSAFKRMSRLRAAS